MNKDSQESIEYRAAMRAAYLEEKRLELVRQWAERDRRTYWPGPEGDKAKAMR